MKQWKKVILGVVLAGFVAAGGAAWYFQNEIKAVQYHMGYSEEEQDALVQENEKHLAEVLEQANLTEEVIVEAQNTAAEKQNENKADVAEQQSQPVKQESAKPVKQEPQKVNPLEQQNYDPELAAMVGEIYALRTSFTGQLDQLANEAIAEYKAVPEDQRSKQKSVIMNKYAGRAGGLESSCDKQMNAILGRMKTHLKNTGGDVTLVKEIEKVYQNEKALKKAYYLKLAE